MNSRTLFLVDADNVSLEVIEKALLLKQESLGAIHVRRCYCGADFAAKNLEFLRQHSIRAMVNATAGKNCTDIALAVDAVQLCNHDRPEVVVIVASDSDFAPLAIHLRELGCRVEGVGQEGKTGAESHLAYDDFIELPGVRKRSSAKAVRPRPVKEATAAPQAPRRAPAVPDDVAQWLEVVPGLASGGEVELRSAAEALRKDKLLSKNGSSTKLFGKYPELFELSPASQPNSVRYAPMPASEPQVSRPSRGRRRN
ncbi:MAG: NYN domain-containing protein [Caldimonas sp.]